MTSWLLKLAELQQCDEPCVMVTVASTVGSTPREVATKMIVTADEVFGTIGGGNLEFQACSIARDQIQSKQLRRFPLGAGLGQCCGGLVNLLFEPMVGKNDWIDTALEYHKLDKVWVRKVPIHSGQVCVREYQQEKTGLLDSDIYIEVNRAKHIELLLFGAGHVGRAIVETMRQLPVRIRWVDNRDATFPAQAPGNVEMICTDSPEAEVDLAGPNAWFLVMTHDHSLDQQLCEQILKRDDFAYFGLIGSQSKRRMFETRMQRRGLDVEKFKRMTCPIGIEGIEGKHPAMIAISVAAQIMQGYDSPIQKIQQKHTRVSSTSGRG
ncbi:MAG: xanthine dehydrogenase accessory protein XdhC [Gammaproteobacteria bacterium]|nr:xanthine dehydrogenase accessory protein XdhC [Gammaproteobacteria bacterium]